MPPSRRCFSLDHLDAGVCLLPGVLSIEFREPIELLQKLYALSQATGHDFELFEDMVKLPREDHGWLSIAGCLGGAGNRVDPPDEDCLRANWQLLVL